MISVRLGGEHKGEHSQCAMGEHWALNWWAQSSPFVLTRVLTYKRMLCSGLGAKWALSTGGGKTTPHTPHIRKARLEGAPMRRPSGTFTQCPPILSSPPCRHGGGPPAVNGAFRGKSNRYSAGQKRIDASREPGAYKHSFFGAGIRGRAGRKWRQNAICAGGHAKKSIGGALMAAWPPQPVLVAVRRPVANVAALARSVWAALVSPVMAWRLP